ncbi:MAG: hypothetical protein HW387_869 [Parachlamydiales bacterium]|nr:hypothetical protein [Parachlamydiales bacterium]
MTTKAVANFSQTTPPEAKLRELLDPCMGRLCQKVAMFVLGVIALGIISFILCPAAPIACMFILSVFTSLALLKP